MVGAGKLAKLAEGRGYRLTPISTLAKDRKTFEVTYSLFNVEAGNYVKGPWDGSFRTLAEVEACLRGVGKREARRI